jgi:hypothetical protein
VLRRLKRNRLFMAASQSIYALYVNTQGALGAGRGAAEHPPQRRLRAPGEHIPQRDIDAGDALRERTSFAGLQRQHRGRGAEMLEHVGRMRHRAPDQHRRQHFVDQSRTMLGADRWKIAPHLAPAGLAVAVFDANEQRRPVAHLAERRHHRRCQRIAEAECLDAADGEGVIIIPRRPGERRDP